MLRERQAQWALKARMDSASRVRPRMVRLVVRRRDVTDSVRLRHHRTVVRHAVRAGCRLSAAAAAATGIAQRRAAWNRADRIPPSLGVTVQAVMGPEEITAGPTVAGVRSSTCINPSCGDHRMAADIRGRVMAIPAAGATRRATADRVVATAEPDTQALRVAAGIRTEAEVVDIRVVAEAATPEAVGTLAADTARGRSPTK